MYVYMYLVLFDALCASSLILSCGIMVIVSLNETRLVSSTKPAITKCHSFVLRKFNKMWWNLQNTSDIHFFKFIFSFFYVLYLKLEKWKKSCFFSRSRGIEIEDIVRVMMFFALVTNSSITGEYVYNIEGKKKKYIFIFFLCKSVFFKLV